MDAFIDALTDAFPFIAIAAIGFLFLTVMEIFLFSKFDNNKNISTNDVNSDSLAEPHSQDANWGKMVMRVDGVMNITGRGIVATGTIQNIPINVNERLNIFDEEGNILEVNVLVKEILKFCTIVVNRAEPGEFVGILLDVEEGLLREGLILKKRNG
ncbi:MAG: hypothetical protein E7637_02455 [Ruminococcaceae bacterium]|nr:hypothetical protein [Oscillospiraceae bacterium]